MTICHAKRGSKVVTDDAREFFQMLVLSFEFLLAALSPVDVLGSADDPLFVTAGLDRGNLCLSVRVPASVRGLHTGKRLFFQHFLVAEWLTHTETVSVSLFDLLALLRAEEFLRGLALQFLVRQSGRALKHTVDPHDDEFFARILDNEEHVLGILEQGLNLF